MPTKSQLQEALARAEARLARMEAQDSPAVRDPSDAVAAIRRTLGDVGALEQEVFLVVILNSRQKVLDTRVVARGSLANVEVHPREVFRDAVRMAAHSILIAHNHPSGDPDPSEADIALTKRMVEAASILGIPVLDHLIFTYSEHRSLQALGLMS